MHGMTTFGLGGALTSAHAELAFALPFILLLAAGLTLAYAKWWRPWRRRELALRHQETIDLLAGMLHDANGTLYGRRMTDRGRYEQWRTDIDAWYADVTTTLELKLGPAERHRFETAGSSALAASTNDPESLYRRDLTILTARMEALREILMRNRNRPASSRRIRPRAFRRVREPGAAGPLHQPQHR